MCMVNLCYLLVFRGLSFRSAVAENTVRSCEYPWAFGKYYSSRWVWVFSQEQETPPQGYSLNYYAGHILDFHDKKWRYFHSLSYSWNLCEEQPDSFVRFLSCRFFFLMQPGKPSLNSHLSTSHRWVSHITDRECNFCKMQHFQHLSTPWVPINFSGHHKPQQIPEVSTAVLPTSGISAWWRRPRRIVAFCGATDCSGTKLPHDNTCGLNTQPPPLSLGKSRGRSFRVGLQSWLSS